MIRLLLMVVWLMGTTLATALETLSLPGTQAHEFVSVHTGRAYQLRIGLPRNYDPTRKRYTVLYQLDGQWDFHRAWALTRALEYDGRLEPMIVCGITYAGDNPNHAVLRERDYTPVDPGSQGRGGDAERFLRTVQHEIIPLMESTYPCRSEERILMGTSFGGLFTAYALLHAPETFTGYVMSSPSIWYGEKVMVTQAQQARPALSGRSLRVRIITGELEVRNQVEGAQAFYDALKAHHLPGLDLTLAYEPEEHHVAMAQVAYLRGLPQVVQPKLITPASGDGEPRDWQAPGKRVDWLVDQVSVSVDPLTGARRRWVVTDPNTPSRASVAFGAIYVLDGQWDYRVIASLYDSLKFDGDASTAILRAGVDWDAPRMSELMRWREQAFTPADSPEAGGGGGAEAYRKWMRETVVPGVEARLATPPGYRMVIASERAALWALTDLLSENPTFDRYLLVSPALGWGEAWMQQIEAARAARGGDIAARVLIYTGGAEPATEVAEPLARWLAQVRSRGYPSLSVEHVELPGRGYAQAKFEGFIKGLRRVIR